MGLTPGEGSEEVRRPHLDSESIPHLPIEVLRSQGAAANQWARAARAQLMVTLAGIAHGANRPLAVLAEELHLKESELAQLISLISARGLDEELLARFLGVCGASYRAMETVEAQLAILRDAEMMQRLYNSERMRRERREREAQAAAREREVAARAVAEAPPVIWNVQSIIPVTAVEDAPGHKSKPDPLTAKTEEEFVDTMRRYRVWARNPSLRDMAQACGQRVSHATFGNMLRASTVPKRFDMVEAFVAALNGTEDEMRVWASAWRHFAVPAPQVVSTQGSQEASILRLPHRKVSESDGYTPRVSDVEDEAGRG